MPRSTNNNTLRRNCLRENIIENVYTNSKFLKSKCFVSKDLRSRTDDSFLLRFLRAKKFDFERALSTIHSHYAIARDNKEIFSKMRPSEIKHVWTSEVLAILPGRDKEGRKIMVFRPGKISLFIVEHFYLCV